MKIIFTEADRIIFYAIRLSKGFFRIGIGLEDVVVACHGPMVRAGFKYDELCMCIRKLLTCKLIEFRKRKIYLTKEYRIKLKESKKRDGRVEYKSERTSLILSNLEKQEFSIISLLPYDFYKELDLKTARRKIRF